MVRLSRTIHVLVLSFRLTWRYFDNTHPPVSVDAYEVEKGPRRKHGDELLLSSRTRWNLLTKEWGCAHHEVLAAVRVVLRLQREQELSQMLFVNSGHILQMERKKKNGRQARQCRPRPVARRLLPRNKVRGVSGLANRLSTKADSTPTACKRRSVVLVEGSSCDHSGHCVKDTTTLSMVEPGHADIVYV